MSLEYAKCPDGLEKSVRINWKVFGFSKMSG